MSQDQEDLAAIVDQFSRIRVDDIDDSDNKAIPHKADVCVRIKPLGAGAGDIEHVNDKMSNKRLDGFDG